MGVGDFFEVDFEVDLDPVKLTFNSALVPSNPSPGVNSVGDENKAVVLVPATKGLVELGAAGAYPFGFVDYIEPGTNDCAVSISNDVRTVPYANADLTIGSQKEIFCDGAGAITLTGTLGAGRLVDVLAVDTVGKTATILY